MLGLALLSGCDYVLGLHRLVDAGTTMPDDARGDGALPVDAKLCFIDTFSDGVDVDVGVWELQTHQDIVIAQNANLVFRFLTTMQAGTAGIRTKRTFDLQGNAVVARLDDRPLPSNETALVVTTVDTPLYAMRVTGDSLVHMLIDGNEVDVAPLGGRDFLRIRFFGTEVLFGASADGIAYDESAHAMSMPPMGVKVQITATSIATISAPAEVTWDFVSVSCP